MVNSGSSAGEDSLKDSSPENQNDAELAARHAELAARDAELAARDAELAARDAIIKSILTKLSLE